MKDSDYGFRKELPGTPFDKALDNVKEELKKEGFGVLTTIDVKAILKEKLDIEHRPYVILGACNPQLAHQALTTDDTIGMLLPCNVVVAETSDGSEVAIARPKAMLSIAGGEALGTFAEDAEVRLSRVLERL
ncbi:MAG: DUF302 domain-containing protein [Gemmatimonadales bacterium]